MGLGEREGLGRGRVGEGEEEGREDRGTGMPMGHF